jgi:EAL domain-containing protein (putative c-di-GMP-specific phosphodiesterase class I)/GGDEF domain-containing protein
MYYKKLLSILPVEYKYKQTDWYKKISSDTTLNKRRVLIISYVSTLFFPASFLIIDLSAGETGYIINYTIPLIILTGILIYILFIKSSELIITITIAIAFTGFFLSVYLPQGRQVSIFIMIVFTPFVFNLTGLIRGAVWSLLFFSAVLLSIILHSHSIIPEWNLVFSDYHLLMIILSMIITFVLVFSGQMQNEKHLGNLIKNLIFDSATKLPNKETMIKSFPRNSGFLLGIVRIQNFSAISSIFGYEIGEKILLFVAKNLNNIARRDGYSCYKLLGHEFGIIIHDKSEVLSDLGIDNFLTLLWFELQSIKLIERDQEFCPSFRIGGAVISAEYTSDALSRADIALNMAEKFLHNTYIYNEKSDDRIHVMRSSELYSTLLDNMRSNNFKIVYQPIVDTVTGAIIWYEALLRVRGKNGSYESVYDYLHVARNTGLYNQLTRFVLQKAHEFIINTGNDISINITLGDIIHPGFMEEVIQICESVKNKKGNLIIEILESEELIEIDLSRRFIRTVQDLGCKVAIDDFGSGYSNFSALLNLSIDIVKIDGLLMKSVQSNSNALSMIESIADFCHKSGKAIVAEYIEDEHMHRIALANNIQFCQGYYFGKPEDIKTVFYNLP